MVNNALTGSSSFELKRKDAETFAIRALSWLASNDDMLTHFCSASGMAPGEIASMAEDPVFLAAVLDFLLLDDEWVLGFASEAGVEPEAVVRARAMLPGGDIPHWT